MNWGIARVTKSHSSKPLSKSSVVKVGSGDREIRIIPDYLLLAANKPAWVLDAKAPKQTITSGPNVEQTYFYAIHPDIRSRYFALCNGKEFALFEKDRNELALNFHISEISFYWEQLYQLLAPIRFLPGGEPLPSNGESPQSRSGPNFYAVAKPLSQITELKRQSAKRHYGVHPYFTRQVWNVVQAYIKNFSQPDDLVLDPFGGTGVTAIEAMVLGRRAIHIDLNPLAVFMVDTLAQPIDLSELGDAYDLITREYQRLVPKMNWRRGRHCRSTSIPLE